MNNKIIIGITGTLGAGKGTVVDYLVKNKGFIHFSAREDVINKEIEKRGLLITRDNMVLVANDLRKNHGPSYVAEELFKMARNSDKNCVLESLRTVGEIESLKKKGKFFLFAVNAEQKTRYSRVQERKNAQSDNVSFEKFIEQEETEMKSDDPNKQNLSKCISMADYVFDNNGTFEELYKKVDEIISKLMNK
jgi:dephospho-CoA kinase